MSTLTELSIAELSSGMRRGDFSAIEVTHAHLENISAKNKELNAFLEVFDDAEEQARDADARIKEQGAAAPPLTGIPIAFKDNILIEGKVASAASRMLQTHVATYDATVIRKLRAAGMVFLGRTNMDEFAMGSSTEHSAFGPTRNPHDFTRVPGGSSGGSAAAVAAHLVPAALGSETCGSIRQPASLCGLVGLKPTYGAVSRYGLIAMGSSLDQIGPLGRTVADVETIFNAIRGHDPYDSTTLTDIGTTARHPLPKTIGVPRAFVTDASPEARESFEKSLAKLASAGYEISDIEFPSAPYGLAAYYIVMPAEVSTNLARFDGMRYGYHAEGSDLLDEYKKSRSGGFGPETRRRVMLGTYVLSSGYYDSYYRRATALRDVLAEDLGKAFGKVSYIATPTTPGPAFKLGSKNDPLSMYLEDIFAAPANLTGIPAITVPSASVQKEDVTLPIGIQFMSPKRTEDSLFAIGKDLMGEYTEPAS